MRRHAGVVPMRPMIGAPTTASEAHTMETNPNKPDSPPGQDNPNKPDSPPGQDKPGPGPIPPDQHPGNPQPHPEPLSDDE